MWQELEIRHVWHDRVGDLRRRAHGVEVEAEITFRRSVHRARLGQSAAVIIESRNVLRHCTGNNHIQVFGVGPNPGDNPLPVILAAFSDDKISELRVGFKNPGHTLTDCWIGDFGADRPGPDVIRQLLPVQLEEADGAEEAGGEDRSDTEDLVAVVEAAQHLSVHALEGVGAEDGLIGAGVHVVRVVGSGLEVFAFVVACENGSGHEPTRSLCLGLDEQKVKPFAFVQSFDVSVSSRHAFCQI